MKPAPFELVQPDSIADAVASLAAGDGEAKALAGGQSLVPLLAMRLARPTTLVDLNRLDELVGIEVIDKGRVRFGAMTRQSALVDCAEHDLVAHAAGWIGHTAIRARGTIGGSIAHADPSAELPSVAVACDASLTVHHAVGTRTIAADDFFVGMFETALGEGDVLASVELARPRRWGFQEFARRDGDFALVSAVAAQLTDGWRLVIGGVSSTPWRCSEGEVVLDAATEGANPDVVANAVAAAIADTVVAFDDIHANAEYRRAMASEFARRAVLGAVSDFAGGDHRGRSDHA